MSSAPLTEAEAANVLLQLCQDDELAQRAQSLSAPQRSNPKDEGSPGSRHDHEQQLEKSMHVSGGHEEGGEKMGDAQRQWAEARAQMAEAGEQMAEAGRQASETESLWTDIEERSKDPEKMPK